MTAAEAFQRFVDTIQALRHPKTGCPWDLEQTHSSLRPYLIEESYEVLEAIDQNDDQELASELGDVLLQVVLHAQVAKDRNSFSIVDVINTVCDKMIRRHPHVFGSVAVAGADEVVKNWEEIKLRERNNEGGAKRSSAFSGIPAALPALLQAQRLGEKAAKVSFDWTDLRGVWTKVLEELGELEQEINRLEADGSNEAVLRALEHEVGDLLFSICQLSRWLKISAEDALRNCSGRFRERFAVMEELARLPLNELSEEELEETWQQAKKRVK